MPHTHFATIGLNQVAYDQCSSTLTRSHKYFKFIGFGTIHSIEGVLQEDNDRVYSFFQKIPRMSLHETVRDYLESNNAVMFHNGVNPEGGTIVCISPETIRSVKFTRDVNGWWWETEEQVVDR